MFPIRAALSVTPLLEGAPLSDCKVFGRSAVLSRLVPRNASRSARYPCREYHVASRLIATWYLRSVAMDGFAKKQRSAACQRWREHGIIWAAWSERPLRAGALFRREAREGEEVFTGARKRQPTQSHGWRARRARPERVSSDRCRPDGVPAGECLERTKPPRWWTANAHHERQSGVPEQRVSDERNRTDDEPPKEKCACARSRPYNR